MTVTANNRPLFRMERFTWVLLTIMAGFLVAALFSAFFMQETAQGLSADSYLTDNSPEAVIHNAYIAYRLGDSDRLEAMYTPEAWKELEEEIRNDYNFGNYGGLDHVLGVRMKQVAIDADSATVQITRYQSYQDGFLGMRSVDSQEVEVDLVREANAWKLVDRPPFSW